MNQSKDLSCSCKTSWTLPHKLTVNVLPNLSSTTQDKIFPCSSQTTHNVQGQIQALTVQRIITEAAEIPHNEEMLKLRINGIICNRLFSLHHSLRTRMRIHCITIKFSSYGTLSAETMLGAKFYTWWHWVFYLPCQQKESWTENWRLWKKLRGNIHLEVGTL